MNDESLTCVPRPLSRFPVRPAALLILLFALLCISVPAANAHPSVSVVIGLNGDVFYSDLAHVWRVSSRGAKSIAVPNVHSHELYMDEAGTLFGEDNQWLGEDRYRHRIWSLRADGTMADVIPWQSGFWRDYGFTRDAQGAMYWLSCTAAEVCSLKRRERNGTVRVVRKGSDVSVPRTWVTAAPNGDVYFCNEGSLFRTRGQRAERVARISSQEGRHSLMGITVDSAGNVYVADHSARAIVIVAPSRVTSVVARSTASWAPAGVALARNGDLWILEWDATRARVRRVSASDVR